MDRTHPRKFLRVRRTIHEYIIPFLWIVLGLFNFVVLSSRDQFYQFIAVVWLLFALINLVILVYKIAVPIMCTDGESISVFPKIFNRTLFKPEDVKAVRAYKHISKIIITYEQMRQNDTILIELKSGSTMTINNKLTKHVREKIVSFLRNFNLELEIMDTK